MSELITIIAGIGLFLGSFMILVSTIGLLRYPDFYTRVQIIFSTTALGTLIMFWSYSLMILEFEWLLRAIAVSVFLFVAGNFMASKLIALHQSEPRSGDDDRTNVEPA